MTLFVDSLDREIDELHASRVRVRFIGDRRPALGTPAVTHRGGRATHRRE